MDAEVRTEVETAEVEHQAEQDKVAASATAEEAVKLAKAGDATAEAEALDKDFKEDQENLDTTTKAAVALEKAEAEADENAK